LGQALVILVLGCVVYSIIEARTWGWTSPVILGLFALAALGLVGILGHERRRDDPLLELGLFRSVPLSTAIVMALFAPCGFGGFLFVITLYLQDVRGMSASTAGLCLLPVGVLVLVLSPVAGRVVGVRGPRIPLAAAGSALALGGVASLLLGPRTPLPGVLMICAAYGFFLGAVNPPITNSAVSGMPPSMAGVASSLASVGRQTGTTLGVAISGTILGPTVSHGDTAFTNAAHSVWWINAGLGIGILILGFLSTCRWANHTATRAARPFAPVDQVTCDSLDDIVRRRL
jgi:predicted MFS family arabinose efflux permease